MEGMVGIGSIFGPVIGSVLYQTSGYSATFYVLGAAMAPSCLFILKIKTIPQTPGSNESVNKTIVDPIKQDDSSQVLLSSDPTSPQETQPEIPKPEPTKQSLVKLTYKDLLKNPRVNFAAMASGVSAMVNGFLEPTLDLRMTDYPSVT